MFRIPIRRARVRREVAEEMRDKNLLVRADGRNSRSKFVVSTQIFVSVDHLVHSIVREPASAVFDAVGVGGWRAIP